MNWVQIFLFSAKHQKFDAFSWDQMHFLKVQYSQQSNLAAFLIFSWRKKKYYQENQAKQAEHNNYQTLILTTSFLDVQLEWICFLMCLYVPVTCSKVQRKRNWGVSGRTNCVPLVLGAAFLVQGCTGPGLLLVWDARLQGWGVPGCWILK